VGDVIVGAHNIVPEDVKLEKSAIVGGGKETYIDTVASSDGKFLSKDEIEKLGLGT
jgi:protein OS-9